MKHPVLLSGLLLALSSLFPAGVLAQTNAPPPVISSKSARMTVVGTNDPCLTSPCFCTVVSELNKVPGGVDVITADEFRTGRAATLKDVLEYSPGVFVQPRFGAEEARISIRGSGLQRTFHGRGIKLMQDGVPLNLADGSFDFQAVEPLSVSYVEVFRGANALRYGATTLGGSVNFVSPTGHEASLAQARFEAGSFDFYRGQLASGAVLGGFDYYVSATHLSTDGYRAHSDQNNQRVFSNFGWRLNDELESRLYFTYVQTYSELPGGLTKAQLETDPTQANPGNVALDQQRNFELIRVANKTVWQRGASTFQLGTFWSHKDLDHPIFQVIDQNSNDLGADARYRNESELFGQRNEFTLGFAPVYGWVDDNRFANVAGNRGAVRGESTQTSYNLDLYAEDQWWAGNQLAFVAGVQLSYANRKFEDRYLVDGNQTAQSDYLGINPKLGFRYEFNEHAQIYGNVSRSFEPPSFGELVRPPGPGAINGLLPLEAQTAWTIELGTRGEAGRVAWDVTWYHAWLNNELLGFEVPGAPGSFATVNADRTTHMGVELGATLRLCEDLFSDTRNGQRGDSLSWRQAYQWNSFHFDGDQTFGNNQLPGVPEHYFRGELLYEHRCGFYFGPNVEWSPKQAPVDMANTLFADPYVIFGLKIGYRTPKGFSAFFEVRNLADQTYAATTGVITRQVASPNNTAQFFPGDGRAFYGGIEWKF